ncbi:hypothetical protein [Egicoccus halophilus]|uniref:Uncharacterized protein n=1 Tax=Egicoccus halophilus TaxID=1670830 RepID=A0A8J3A8I9_9ACTN|nr:hypothetical protein [Egicoccus halophilus]GGI04441.1 hypothetical protein GCM10011354_09110 [Egicoccus halophilus]
MTPSKKTLLAAVTAALVTTGTVSAFAVSSVEDDTAPVGAPSVESGVESSGPLEPDDVLPAPAPAPAPAERPTAEEPTDAPAPVPVDAPAPAPGPAAGVAEPELEVDEDGCVTDLTTGLVIACADEAEGPDEGSEEYCLIDPTAAACLPEVTTGR